MQVTRPAIISLAFPKSVHFWFGDGLCNLWLIRRRLILYGVITRYARRRSFFFPTGCVTRTRQLSWLCPIRLQGLLLLGTLARSRGTYAAGFWFMEKSRRNVDVYIGRYLSVAPFVYTGLIESIGRLVH